MGGMGFCDQVTGSKIPSIFGSRDPLIFFAKEVDWNTQHFEVRKKMATGSTKSKSLPEMDSSTHRKSSQNRCEKKPFHEDQLRWYYC